MEPKRVVSLIASATEIVSSVGRLGWLVGRSHECDHPPEIRDLPSCSVPGLKTDVPSGEIDRSVKPCYPKARPTGISSRQVTQKSIYAAARW